MRVVKLVKLGGGQPPAEVVHDHSMQNSRCNVKLSQGNVGPINSSQPLSCEPVSQDSPLQSRSDPPPFGELAVRECEYDGDS